MQTTYGEFKPSVFSECPVFLAATLISGTDPAAMRRLRRPCLALRALSFSFSSSRGTSTGVGSSGAA